MFHCRDHTAEFPPGSRILRLPFRRSKPLLSLASHKNSLDRTSRSMRSPARRRNGRYARTFYRSDGRHSRWMRPPQIPLFDRATRFGICETVSRLLGPIRQVPRHRFLLARFGLPALLPASALARHYADMTPRQLLRIAASQLPSHYCRRLKRFRYGAGAFKIDYALSAPIPWAARDCSRATTVHLGGSLAEIVESERTFTSDRPFVLLGQPSLFDPTRAPVGKHTAWAYCHVPNGCAKDCTELIENQIARFAPDFRDCILTRSVSPPARLEQWNPNLIGGTF